MDVENGQYPILISFNEKAIRQSMVIAEGILAITGPVVLGQFYASGNNAMSEALDQLLATFSFCTTCLWLCVASLRLMNNIPRLLRRPIVLFARNSLNLLSLSCLCLVFFIFMAALSNGQLGDIFVALMLSMLSFAKAIEKLLDMGIYNDDQRNSFIAAGCAIIAVMLSTITFPFIAAKTANTFLQSNKEDFDLWIIRNLFEIQKKLSLSIVLTSILIEFLSPTIVNSLAYMERGKIRNLAFVAICSPAHVYFALCLCSLASFNAEFIIFSSMRHFMYTMSFALLLGVVSDKLGIDVD